MTDSKIIIRLVFAMLSMASGVDVSANARDIGASTSNYNPKQIRILEAIDLYVPVNHDLPTAERAEQEIWNKSARLIINVSSPTVIPVLPATGAGNGTAVVIAPGGGNYFLVIDSEGMQEARWLAERGIAAFVLKYRTKQIDPAKLNETIENLLAAVAVPGSDVYNISNYGPANDDGKAALQLVRERAQQWGISTGHVGFMGFSAGALMALRLATASDVASRPSFVIPMYPSLDTILVPKDVPPMFGAIALDDKLFRARGFGLLTAWQASGRPFEFHLYEKGGHGFGMGAQGTTTTRWLDDLYAWMIGQGLANNSP